MSETVPVAELLAANPLLQRLSESTRAAFAREGRRRLLERGSQLFREGQPADSFYVVLSGAVRLYRINANGEEQILHWARTGDTVGEAAALTMPAFPVSACAALPGTEVLSISAEGFGRLIEDEPGVALTVIGSLCCWLHRLVRRVDDLSEPSTDVRLARYLLTLPADEDASRFSVRLPTTKREVAAYLRITPETLSRVFRRWQDDGVVEVGRRGVVIAHPEALIALASGSLSLAGTAA